MTHRTAIIGFGKIARDQHAPTIAAHPEFELTAVMSPQGGPDGVPLFASMRDLLECDLGVEAVALCQPPQARFDAALEAILAGRHVLLEKPPGLSLSEVEILSAAAEEKHVTLFAAWHSRYAPGVAAAREWLAGQNVRAVEVEWREDVRHWHPGQDWIWEAGGFGVFDPGINAISILTTILPQPFCFSSGSMDVPSNLHAPVAASLGFREVTGARIGVELDFLQTGPQTWDIRIETTAGRLRLSMGGARLEIDGAVRRTPEEAEYRAVYDRFAELIAAGQSDVDTSPLRHVADAFMGSRRRRVEPFIE